MLDQPPFPGLLRSRSSTWWPASATSKRRAQQLKLAEEHADDLAAYTGGKQAFVARVLAGVGEMALESRSGAQGL
jgi:hypothetical protein